MRALPIAIGVVTGALTLNGVLAVAQGLGSNLLQALIGLALKAL